MKNVYEVLRRPLITEKSTAKAYVVLKKGEQMAEFFDQA